MPSLFMPMMDGPFDDERPTEYADRVGRAYANSRSAQHKKRLGQFMTPVVVADYMASLMTCDRDQIRILDPGAGSGVLACAAAEAIARRSGATRCIAIDAYECDPDLIPILHHTLLYLESYLQRFGIKLTFQVISNDFILDNADRIRREKSLFAKMSAPEYYDVVASNPPYFKLPKNDERVRATNHIVHGQPNVYALFMAISAALLSRGGELVFITPRSFSSGSYFKRFRADFFTRIQPQALHVFDSRKDAFSRDGVLQENMILKGRRADWLSENENESESIEVSSSRGVSDLATRRSRVVPLSTLLDMASKEKMLRVLSSNGEEYVIAQIDKWKFTLKSFGIQVSTGPVVPFRATDLLSMSGNGSIQHAPLLWLQNIRPMRVEWPTSVRKKPQYISTRSRATASLLVEDRNYVLLRRFSAKEENRRLIAAPLLMGQLESEWIGIENHVNYIHRPGGSLTEDEAMGLAAIYNSRFMDIYFRALNGSTQVSATEIRKMPLPPHTVIIEIGQRAAKGTLSDSEIEGLVRIESEQHPEVPT